MHTGAVRAALTRRTARLIAATVAMLLAAGVAGAQFRRGFGHFLFPSS